MPIQPCNSPIICIISGKKHNWQLIGTLSISSPRNFLHLSQLYIYPRKKQHLVYLKKFSMPRPACQHHLLCLNALWDRSHKPDNLTLISFGSDSMCQPSHPLWANHEHFCCQFSFRSPSTTGLQQNFLCCLWEQKGSQSTEAEPPPMTESSSSSSAQLRVSQGIRAFGSANPTSSQHCEVTRAHQWFSKETLGWRFKLHLIQPLF